MDLLAKRKCKWFYVVKASLSTTDIYYNFNLMNSKYIYVPSKLKFNIFIGKDKQT